MNKFIDNVSETKTKTSTRSRVKEKALLKGVEVVNVGSKQFIICPKCNWKHVYTEEKCRFCGETLRG